jgi:dipeptidyl aminopeptidase/acylaminoacyl peptidase
MRTIALVLAAACLLPAKTAITHESMWLMQRVGAPSPSPDGKWVVFSVNQPAYDEKDQTSDLWIVPTDRSAKPRRLTTTKGTESGAVWTPDSQRILFSAKREGDEAAQIYVLDLGGGEAQRLTSLAMGAAHPQASPDGKWVLFTSRVIPGAKDEEENKKLEAERKARKFKARVYDSFPIRHWDKWLEEYQTHLFVQALDATAKAKDLLAGSTLAAEKGFGGVLGSESETLPAAWSPDSRTVVFAATTTRNASAYANVVTHLYRVPAEGGEIRAITSGTEASYSRPDFGPDGSLYALHSREGSMPYSLNRLARFSWPETGQPVLLTNDFDRSVSSFAFAPDGKTIYLTAEDAGNEKLYSVASDGGAVRTAIDLKVGCYSNLRIPEKANMLIANWQSAVNPAEVVAIDPGSRAHNLLTQFNVAKAAELDIRPLQHYWFTSKSGKRIHNMLAVPPDFDESKKYPLLALIHGGPHGMWRDEWVYRWNYHLLAKPGYVVLLTNYTGSTGFGEKFAQDIQGDPLRGPGDEINQAVDQAIAKFPFIDKNNLAAGGASYGGHLANWLQATTTRYKCLISHAGLINLESQWGTSDTIFHRERVSGGPVWEQGRVWREQNPIRYAKNFKTPILVTVGENDFRVPVNQSIENWSVLQRMKVPSRLIVFPDENHWILKAENSRFFFEEVHKWLGQWLKPVS